jgi:hypothetical protein
MCYAFLFAGLIARPGGVATRDGEEDEVDVIAERRT